MTAVDMTPQLDAREVFKAAYENRYTWDPGFPGYTANFTLKVGYDMPVSRSGDQLLAAGEYSGQVVVPADLDNLNGIKVTGIENELVVEWVTNQIKDIITHRKRSDFESAHGKHTFFLDGEPDSTGAVPIGVTGDSMGSHYKIRDRQVVQVAREMGRMAFTINHLESQDTPQGYLSARYTAVFKNPQDGSVINQLRFDDAYEEFKGYYVMTHHLVEGQSQGSPSRVEITFTDVQMG